MATRRSTRISTRSASRRANTDTETLFSPYHEHNTRLARKLKATAEVEVGNVPPSPYQTIRRVLDFDEELDDDDPNEGVHAIVVFFTTAWAYVISHFEPLRKQGYFNTRKHKESIVQFYHRCRLAVYDSRIATALRDDETYELVTRICYCILAFLLFLLLWPHLPGLPALPSFSLPVLTMPSFSSGSSSDAPSLDEVAFSEPSTATTAPVASNGVDPQIVDELKAALQTVNSNLKKLSSRYETLAEKNARLEQANTALAKDLLEKTQSTENVLAEKLQQLESQLRGSWSEDIAQSVQGVKAEMGSTISDLRTGDMGEEINAVKLSLQTLESQTQESVSGTSTAVETLSTTVSTIHTDVEGIRTDLEGKISKVKQSLERAVELWQSQAASGSSDDGDRATISQDLLTRFATLEDAVTELRDAQAQFKKDSDGFAQTDAINEKITAQTGEVERKIAELGEALSTLAQQSQVDESVAEVRQEIAAVLAQVEQASVNTPSTSADSGQGSSDDDAEKAELREQLSVLKEAMAAVQSEVEELKNSVASNTAAATPESSTGDSDASAAAAAATEANEKLAQELRQEIAQLSSSTQERIAALKESIAKAEAQAGAAAQSSRLAASTGDGDGDGDGVAPGRVQQLIDQALDRYSADRIGLPDYALASAGASVLVTHTSPSLGSSSSTLSALLPIQRLFNRLPHLDPTVALNADTSVGNCWAFDGSTGHITIRLSETIRVTAVSIDHIPQSISRHMESAPRSFSVRAYSDILDIDEEGATSSRARDLGTFEFNLKGRPVQTFQTQPDTGATNVVQVALNSNYGHPYTCVYRIRVHGERIDSQA